MKKTFCYFLLLAILAISDNTAFGQYVWTKDTLNNPVLSGAGNGTWNKHVVHPSVLFNADSARYEMWFAASAGPETPNWCPYHIGFAISENGINWTMHPTAVLSPDPGTWDEYTVIHPTVIRENGQYKMWYTGSPDYVVSMIGYATSPDGITWTKHPNNPVLGLGTSAWESGGPWSCNVMKVEGGYKMWYGAYEAYPSVISRIGYATSVDGIVWQRDTLNNPVLTIGASGKWDDHWLLDPQVLCINTTYYMWYCGAKVSSGARQIGLATSPNGIVWTKYVTNPVLALSLGNWDANYVGSKTVLLIGDTFHMWYDGSRDDTGINLWRIGHATLPLQSASIVEAEKGIAPKYFNLEQNYPNPFNPSTTIRFEIPVHSNVTLKIYDLFGREVATVVNENLNAGSHKAFWNATGFASGVYLYRLQAGKYTEVKKLILLK